jgi:two-component SAPR family response regulator
MNCIIVDDDKLSCKILEEYVSKSTSLNIIGSFSDSVAARNVLTKRNDIDLIFLDIQMPELDGLILSAASNFVLI